MYLIFVVLFLVEFWLLDVSLGAFVVEFDIFDLVAFNGFDGSEFPFLIEHAGVFGSLFLFVFFCVCNFEDKLFNKWIAKIDESSLGGVANE